MVYKMMGAMEKKRFHDALTCDPLMTRASDDPAAVRAHVNSVPMKAWATGE